MSIQMITSQLSESAVTQADKLAFAPFAMKWRNEQLICCPSLVKSVVVVLSNTHFSLNV